MKRKGISVKTCLLMGACGAVLQVIEGVLVLARLGAASFLHNAQWALIGAMLLFLALAAKGEANKSKRIQLLILFLLLLVGWTVPVPVGPLAAMFVIPILLGQFRRVGDGPFIGLSWAVEALYAVAYTLGATGFTGPFDPLLVIGVSILVLGAVRSVVLLRLYLRTVSEAPA